MIERERLIEYLKRISYVFDDNRMLVGEPVEYVANYLLDNGVIVPPCKVGDVVYEALTKVNHIRSSKVVGFHLGKFPTVLGLKRKEYLVCYSDYSLTHIDIKKFGKTVFLTKEEAEKALEGMKCQNKK